MDFNSDKVRWGILIVAGVLLTVLVYGQIADQVAEIEQSTPSVQVRWHASGVVKGGPQISNPASVNCIKLGGILKIETDPSGGQYGVCNFPNGNVCEEWALLRGQCPPAGVSVKEMISPQGIFCVIHGGVYKVIKPGDVRTEVGTCTPPGSTESCDATAFRFAMCPATVTP
jgi:putative hemolysin